MNEPWQDTWENGSLSVCWASKELFQLFIMQSGDAPNVSEIKVSRQDLIAALKYVEKAESCAEVRLPRLYTIEGGDDD